MTKPEVAVEDDAPMTIDELSAAVGLSVRTTRYYASLGLLPAPRRRGRLAYYGAVHRARLELVRALQEHGFTLQAVERYVSGIPATAGVEELALQRAMLTSWTAEQPVELSGAELDQRAGRQLSDDEVELLIRLRLLERVDDGYRATPHLQLGLDLLELAIPAQSVSAAGAAIEQHMAGLADELTAILRADVLVPYREAHAPEDTVRLEAEMQQLRRLTLQAVVAGFQQAANDVIIRSLAAD